MIEMRVRESSSGSHCTKVCMLFPSGEPQQFCVVVNSSANYPLDLYILMDLSGSMENDLATIQSLSNRLGRKHINKLCNSLCQLRFPFTLLPSLS